MPPAHAPCAILAAGMRSGALLLWRSAGGAAAVCLGALDAAMQPAGGEAGWAGALAWAPAACAGSDDDDDSPAAAAPAPPPPLFLAAGGGAGDVALWRADAADMAVRRGRGPLAMRFILFVCAHR
jgi:hypothetical protein